jgi:hypothetical protein
MKTRTLIRNSVGVLASGLFATAALAGPGPENWNQGKASTPRACTDARLVTVTETKPSLHNGRGPLVTTVIGRKLECTSCDTPMIVMKRSAHNGRGAMAPVEIKGKHDCSKNGCGTPVASTN